MVTNVPQVLQVDQLPRGELLGEGVLDELAELEGQYL